MRHQINNKADKLETYPTAEINVALGILQAGIHRKVGINVVDTDGKFKLHDVLNGIFKMHRVDVSLVYDAFELSFHKC